MTVKELIDILSEFPPDYTVKIIEGECGCDLDIEKKDVRLCEFNKTVEIC